MLPEMDVKPIKPIKPSGYPAIGLCMSWRLSNSVVQEGLWIQG
jgi:hypothetical protein